MRHHRWLRLRIMVTWTLKANVASLLLKGRLPFLIDSHIASRVLKFPQRRSHPQPQHPIRIAMRNLRPIGG